MQRISALICTLLSACALLTPQPQTPPPLQPPSATALRVDGELAGDDERYERDNENAPRVVDRYRIAFTQSAQVRIWLTSPTLAPRELNLDIDSGGLAEIFTNGFATFTSSPGSLYRVSVAGADLNTAGNYQLVIDPPPARIDAPPRNDAETRRARVMKQRELSELSRTPAQTSSDLQNALRGYSKGNTLRASLEKLDALELPMQADHCYKVVVKLEKGARFSEIARRGMTGGISLEKDKLVRFRVFGPSALFVETLCAKQTAAGRFSIATRAFGMEHEVGTGPVSLELWSIVSSPFAESVATRDRAIAKYTKGFTAQAPRQVNLAKLSTLEVPVAHGQCTVAVLKLDKGASFSSETRAENNISIDLNTPGLDYNAGPGVLGPGAVAAFPCISGGIKAKLAFRGGKPLGTGSATLQLYTRIASAAELRQLAAEDRAQARDSARDSARMKNEACQSCIEEKINCSRGSYGHCYEQFLTCVRSKGYRESACGG